jgi:hypothetical protein
MFFHILGSSAERRWNHWTRQQRWESFGKAKATGSPVVAGDEVLGSAGGEFRRLMVEDHLQRLVHVPRSYALVQLSVESRNSESEDVGAKRVDRNDGTIAGAEVKKDGYDWILDIQGAFIFFFLESKFVWLVRVLYTLPHHGEGRLRPTARTQLWLRLRSERVPLGQLGNADILSRPSSLFPRWSGACHRLPEN